jgi:hypothetical protein
MIKLAPVRQSRLWLIVTSGILLLSGICIYLFMHVSKKPLTPGIPMVSVCKESAPEMRRIGERYGVQFDVPAEDFVFHEGTSDTPPVVHGFVLRPKSSKSLLDVSYGPGPYFDNPYFDNMPIDSARVFSKHVEKRTILNDKGHPVGEDNWGYLSSAKRWRQVRFWRGDAAAKYGFVDEKEAELFDRVINSACLLPSPGS